MNVSLNELFKENQLNYNRVSGENAPLGRTKFKTSFSLGCRLIIIKLISQLKSS